MGLIDVGPDNVAETGFFCKMSQRKNAGWQRKLRWLEKRFAEGMTIKMLDISKGWRGFIEYTPGEHAFRPVEAAGTMFVHCLWVVGKSKGKGHARRLLDACVADAKRKKLRGVAMVTSDGNWLVGKSFLERHGFEAVDSAPPSYELLYRPLRRGARPSFPGDWAERAKKLGKGLTVVRTDQCPYLDDASAFAARAAERCGLKFKAVELKTAREVRERAPSPYGVFSVVLDGAVLSHHYLTEKTLLERLEAAGHRPRPA